MANETEIKIYDMDGGITWFAAASEADAVRGYEEYLGYEDPSNAEDVREIKVKDYDHYRYAKEWEGEPLRSDDMSFRERLNEMIASGEKFPCFFASTEY